MLHTHTPTMCVYCDVVHLIIRCIFFFYIFFSLEAEWSFIKLPALFLQLMNMLPIKSWSGDKEDKELQKLIPYLERVSGTVR